jgi:SAM-dependent methyltransferase
MDDYEDKLKREQKWYSDNKFQNKHFLNSRLFYSVERNAFNFHFARKQFAMALNDVVTANDLHNPAILISPIGSGDDIPYVKNFSRNISGIDISKEAIDMISDPSIDAHVGDMRHMTIYPDNEFDIVIVPLFFHHFVKYGFDPFVRESYRTLKPGGHFISLEPCSFHPVSWLTIAGKKVFGNITGTVEDETPFNPFMLSKSMKRCGFTGVKVYGASFSHCRLPISIAKINNSLTFPLLRIPAVKFLAWMCIFYGRKCD